MNHALRLTIVLVCASAGLSFGHPAAGAAANQRPAQQPADAPVICPICSRTTNQADYASKAGNTLVRGATNALLGWTELIHKPAHEVKTHGGRNTRNVLSGVVKGIGQGAARTASGVAELFTFWIPKVQGSYVTFSKDCPICMGQHTPAPPASAAPPRSR
jgi:putative exosortase-associated protein (TIGR04073 family)